MGEVGSFVVESYCARALSVCPECRIANGTSTQNVMKPTRVSGSLCVCNLLCDRPGLNLRRRHLPGSTAAFVFLRPLFCVSCTRRIERSNAEVNIVAEGSSALTARLPLVAAKPDRK